MNKQLLTYGLKKLVGEVINALKFLTKNAVVGERLVKHNKR